MPTFSDLRTAAYCPRKLYYARQSNREPPALVDAVRALACRYDELLEASDDELAALPIARSPAAYRAALVRSRETVERWDELVDPPSWQVFVNGRQCRGVINKVLEGPLAPVIVSPGSPPDRGVWTPHSVVAVAAAKALAWERETPVDEAVVEYPAYGVIRPIRLTTERRATYRRTLRTVRTLDGPPPRTRNQSKCESCSYVDECGVRTRTLRTLLGRG